MNYFDNQYKLMLSKYYIFDSWQFIMNTQKNINTAEYCRIIIEKTLMQMQLEHKAFQDEVGEKIETMLETGESIAIRSNDMPENVIHIMDMQVSAYFIIEKYLKDYFQYIRNSFDVIAQYINVALLSNESIDVDKVDFGTISKKMDKYKGLYPLTHNCLLKIGDDPEFKYISAFNNRIKHTYDVNNIISFSVFGDGKKMIINEFSKYGVMQREREIEEAVQTVNVFTNKAISEVLEVVSIEINKNIFNTNRVHNLKYIMQNLNDSKSNYIAIFLEVEDEFSQLPKEIRVLLLKENECVEAYNSTYDDILIRNKNEHFIGRYISSDVVEKNGLLKYRKYTLDECNEARAFIEHIKKSYSAMPFMMDGIIITDK